MDDLLAARARPVAGAGARRRRRRGPVPDRLHGPCHRERLRRPTLVVLVERARMLQTVLRDHRSRGRLVVRGRRAVRVLVPALRASGRRRTGGRRLRLHRPRAPGRPRRTFPRSGQPGARERERDRPVRERLREQRGRPHSRRPGDSGVDVIIANAPYVPSGELALMPPEARLYEPRVALDGGADGLDLHVRIAARAESWLAPGGHLLIETSRRQATRTAELIAQGGLVPRIIHDRKLDATVVIGTGLALKAGLDFDTAAHATQPPRTSAPKASPRT